MHATHAARFLAAVDAGNGRETQASLIEGGATNTNGHWHFLDGSSARYAGSGRWVPGPSSMPSVWA